MLRKIVLPFFHTSFSNSQPHLWAVRRVQHHQGPRHFQSTNFKLAPRLPRSFTDQSTSASRMAPPSLQLESRAPVTIAEVSIYIKAYVVTTLTISRDATQVLLRPLSPCSQIRHVYFDFSLNANRFRRMCCLWKYYYEAL